MRYDVAFRVDGDRRIGMGHTMRCISVADQLKKRGLSTIFIASTHDTDALLSEYGYDCIALENDQRDKQGEVDGLLALLEKLSVRLVFVDSYETSTAYLLPLASRYAVAVFGKHTQYEDGFDLLIDYNIQYDEQAYARLRKEGRELLLGAGFTPLRSQFVGQERISLRDEVKHVLITTGGSDKYNITGELLKRLTDKRYQSIHFDVILGHLFDRGALENRYGVCENVTLHANVHDMAALYKKTDLAICAGGTTLYELLAMGVPTVVFSFSDNQNAGLYMQKFVTHCGDIRRGDGVDVSGILKAFEEMLPIEKRAEAQKKGSGLVDGDGAIRIADRIEKLLRGISG